MNQRDRYAMAFCGRPTEYSVPLPAERILAGSCEYMFEYGGEIRWKEGLLRGNAGQHWE